LTVTQDSVRLWDSDTLALLGSLSHLQLEDVAQMKALSDGTAMFAGYKSNFVTVSSINLNKLTDVRMNQSEQTDRTSSRYGVTKRSASLSLLSRGFKTLKDEAPSAFTSADVKPTVTHSAPPDAAAEKLSEPKAGRDAATSMGDSFGRHLSKLDKILEIADKPTEIEESLKAPRVQRVDCTRLQSKLSRVDEVKFEDKQLTKLEAAEELETESKRLSSQGWSAETVDVVASVPSPSNPRVLPLDLYARLTLGSNSATATLSARVTHLKLLSGYWASGSMPQLLSHLSLLESSTDGEIGSQFAILADFLKAIDLKAFIITLETAANLLPILLSMLEQSSEPHILITALAATLSLVESFGDLIRQTRSMLVAGGVDMAREQRLTRCNACFDKLSRIYDTLQMFPQTYPDQSELVALCKVVQEAIQRSLRRS
jgi:hypothetical protein